MKNAFLLYKNHAEIFEKLSDEQAGKLIKAIFEYERTGIMPKLEPLLDMAFTPIKQTIDIDAEKYAQKVEKRREAGSKGGKQRVANQANASKSKQKQANQADNDNDNDKDNDKDIYKKENIKEKAEKIHFAEFVTMSNVEYETLVNTHGKEFADQCITRLDNYKGSSGKTYKSDYRAILSWVIDEVKKNQGKVSKSNAYVNDKQSEYNDLDRFYN